MVTTDLLEEFKDRMHISHSSEDSNLEKLLSFSVSYVKSKCGDFEPGGKNINDKQATELVLERTRYAYNDALEYFEDNFLSEIFSLGIEMSDIDAEV